MKNEQAIQKFREIMMQSAVFEQYRDYPDCRWTEILENHFKVLQSYDATAPKIHVFNPKLLPNEKSPPTVIAIVMRDRPFLVDTLTLGIEEQGYTVRRLLNTIAHIEFSKIGNKAEFLSIDLAKDSNEKEVSLILTSIDRLSNDQLLPLQKKLTERIKLLDEVVSARKPIQEKMRLIIEEIKQNQHSPNKTITTQNAVDFLQWLMNNNFNFLGYREYKINNHNNNVSVEKVGGSGLGLLVDDGTNAPSKSFQELPDSLRKLAVKPQFLFLSKSHQKSLIHRNAYMDFVSVQKFDKKGKVIGEHRFIGLFTSNAYRSKAEEIPILREKMQAVLDKAAFPKNGQSAKKLRHILNTFPRDDLFQSCVDTIYPIVTGILQLNDKDRLRFFHRIDEYRRFISCFVYIPRERFRTSLRLQIQQILSNLCNAHGIEYTAQFYDRHHVCLHLHLQIKACNKININQAEIEKQLNEKMQDFRDAWADQVCKKSLPVDQTAEIIRIYKDNFPVAYRADFSIDQAVDDAYLLFLLQKNQTKTVVPKLTAGENSNLLLKIYGLGKAPDLTKVLPVLEHFGVIVSQMRPYYFEVADGQWIQAYDLALPEQKSIDLTKASKQVEDAFNRIWIGEVESDKFNSLILKADLQVNEAVLLRALAKYMLQAGVSFSLDYIQQTVNKNLGISKKIIDAFHAKMQPNKTADEAKSAFDQIIVSIKKDLDQVKSLDEDRILRWYLQLLQAMVRTNFYQKNENGEQKNRLSFKFLANKIVDLPKPKPLFEIFVYSAKVEAVHLRGGKVARGGLRWSDRMEDFRTEILGLVKAQMVKNSVIVPVGSKGGFVVKNPVTDKAQFIEQGKECYRIFIRGLLDLTDNLVGGKIVAPANTLRHDEDDPYLVVAADKGTASFSDIANKVAKEYNFWLDDAFASGGSNGYDHKGMGITARGGWESVKRHFRLMGKNIQKEDFSCIGIGDMSGDVFGNGMLLSKHTKLLAAFNHLDIFIDPNPDSEKSFAERKRLFEQKLGWGDYQTDLISKGGGVFSRQIKSIDITAEMKQAFAIEEDQLTPNQLINRLLQAPVDLIWNGGIGTYVKSSKESNLQVGDRANDNLRINATQIRAKAIGEGGNLGMTQLGRIEAAQCGVRLYTDAIDNSGGVNCSDHEVNIKILLNQAIEQGLLNKDDRNNLLAQMTDQVAELVLRQNYLQPQVIELEKYANDDIFEYQRIMEKLENASKLDRAIEYLPDFVEIKARSKKGESLINPELAVLLAYSKMWVYEHLINSDVPDFDLLQQELIDYFPKQLGEKYRDIMKNHRLMREIISTHLTNSLVNRMGIGFAFKVVEETGKSLAEAVKAYVVARNIFNLNSYWQAVESLDNQVSAKLQIALELRIRQMLERATGWFLRNIADPFAIDINQYNQAFKMILDESSIINQKLVNYHQNLISDWEKQGLDNSLAKQFALLSVLPNVLDWVMITKETGDDLAVVIEKYFGVIDCFKGEWLVQKINQLPGKDYWEIRAKNTQQIAYYQYLRRLTQQLLKQNISLDDWMTDNQDLLKSIDYAYQNDQEITLATISVLLAEMAKSLTI